MGLYNPSASSITLTPATTSTEASTTVSLGSTVSSFLSANASRKKVIFTNTGTSPAYVDYSNTVGASSFAFVIQPNGTYIEDSVPYLGTYYGTAGNFTTTLAVRDFS